MLSNALVYPSLPAVDINRAKRFYQDKLGLKLVAEDPSPGATFQAGMNSFIYLYQRGATKADHTVAMFMVDNLDSEVKDMRNKGIKFEEYDMPQMGIKTVNGIATTDFIKSAWFKDTEGNILAVGELTDAKMKAAMSMKSAAGMTR